MERLLGRLADVAYAAMRVVLAFLFFCHGIQKLTGALGGQQVALGSLRGVASLIETVGGPLIAIGLFTSPVAFIASGEMAAAYFISHAPRGGLPVQNRGELAVALCFVFLYIATRGGGRFSLDRVRRRT